MIAAMVAPGGARSIAMMRARLVSDRAFCLDDADVGRFRDGDLAVLRTIERVAAFGLDLDLVMGSSKVCATSSAAPPQPCPGETRQGSTQKRSPATSSPHSNAQFAAECQSIPSKMIALLLGS